MLDTFWNVFGQMMVVLMLLLIGYVFNRKKWMPKEAEIVLSKLVTLLFLPSLTFNTFLTRCTVENLRQYSSLVLYGSVLVLAMILLSYPVAKLIAGGDSYKAGVLRYCISFPNTGAVGTPLVIALFGTMGLFQFNLFNLGVGIACYSWGIAQLLPSHGKKTFWQSMRSILNPNFLAMVFGGILGITGVAAKLPEVVFSGLDRVGTCYTIVSLILTGFIIADYRPQEILGDKKVYLVTALRLIVLPGLVLAGMKFMHASVLLLTMTCLHIACPCGMNVVVFPAAYRMDSRFGASLVLITSALSVITVPIIYTLVTAV